MFVVITNILFYFFKIKWLRDFGVIFGLGKWGKGRQAVISCSFTKVAPFSGTANFVCLIRKKVSSEYRDCCACVRLSFRTEVLPYVVFMLSGKAWGWVKPYSVPPPSA